jgi:pilus assembly protein Flp/PilA
MKTIRESISNFLAEEEGPTAVEYAVMLALVIGVCIGSVLVLADNTGESFNRSSDAIAAAFAN